MNAGLTSCFTIEEINDALTQMHPLKALDQMVLGFVFISSTGTQLVKRLERQL